MKQSVRRMIHKYSLYSTKWQKYPKHGQWYDNMNKRYIKTNYRKSEKLFYFEDALNKSICLWKQKYYATENENLRRVLWLEYLRIEDRVYYDIVNKDRYMNGMDIFHGQCIVLLAQMNTKIWIVLT